nr:MAG TPA: hypothetical protein [Caudoviricetes sp.]
MICAMECIFGQTRFLYLPIKVDMILILILEMI